MRQKYISTKEAVRLTGLSTDEIYDLIHSGTLPTHKAPKSGWSISPQDGERTEREVSKYAEPSQFDDLTGIEKHILYQFARQR